jgi:uncharacterized membrane protein (UPF0127 family)
LAGAVFYPFVSSTKKCDYQSIEVNKISVCSRIADSDYERVAGLSGVKSLDKYDALLFVFEKEDKHGIWMKNMLMPIDILWLDSNKRIIHKEENVSPGTYPKVFYPKSNAKYVLETKTGFIEDNTLNLLDQFRW